MPFACELSEARHAARMESSRSAVLGEALVGEVEAVALGPT